MIPTLPNIRPKYFYNFSKPRTSPPGMLFARASQLRYPINAKQKLVEANIPLTTNNGLIIEKQSTNYMALANGPVTEYGGNTKAKVLNNTMSSPAGVVTVTTAATTTSEIIGYRDLATHRANNTDYCISAYVKRGAARFAAVIFSSYDVMVSPIEAYFDFDKQEILATNNGEVDTNATLNRVGFEEVGDGWYRIWMNTRTISNAATYSGFMSGIYFRGNNGATVKTGSVAANTIAGYFCGMQVEIGKYPTSFIQTNGSAVTRSKSIGDIKIDPLKAFTIVATYKQTKDVDSVPIGLYSNNVPIGAIFATGSDAIPVNRLLLDYSTWVGNYGASTKSDITVIASIEPGIARSINSSGDQTYGEISHNYNTLLDNLKLGESVHWTNFGYTGTIKNIAVYDRALDERQMRALIGLYK